MVNNVIAQALGGQRQILDGVRTVADCRAKLGLSAQYKGSIGGRAAADTDVVKEGDYVSFAEAVKGA